MMLNSSSKFLITHKTAACASAFDCDFCYRSKVKRHLVLWDRDMKLAGLVPSTVHHATMLLHFLCFYAVERTNLTKLVYDDSSENFPQLIVEKHVKKWITEDLKRWERFVCSLRSSVSAIRLHFCLMTSQWWHTYLLSLFEWTSSPDGLEIISKIQIFWESSRNHVVSSNKFGKTIGHVIG